MIQLPGETQTDWSGGCNNRLTPEQLGPNQYADAKNIEIRDGYPRTRRGSAIVYEWVDEHPLQGSHLYRSPYKAQRPETIVSVRNGSVYRQNVPHAPVEMDLPSGVVINANESIRFVQAFSYIYMLRDEHHDVLRWSGWPADSWELISTPVAGDKFPNTGLGAYAYNRGWVVTNEDSLSASDILSEAFDLATHSYELDQGEGGEIVGIIPYLEGGLCVVKEGGVHILTGCNGDLTDLADTVIDSTHGGISAETLTQIGSDVWFLARDGVRSIAVTIQSKAQMVDVTVSHNIPKYINRINWSHANKAQALVFDNYYLLAVPFDNATVNDTMLVFDLQLKTWVGYWQGWEVQRMFVGRLRGNQVLYGMNNNGDLSILLHGMYEDSAPTNALTTMWFYDVNAAGTPVPCAMRHSEDSGAVLASWGDVCFDVTIKPVESDYFVNGSITDFTVTGNRELISISGQNRVVSFVLANVSGVYYLCGLCYDVSLPSPNFAWRFSYALTGNFYTTKYSITLAHDGSEPLLYINGNLVSVTYSVSVDKSMWTNADFGQSGLISLGYSVAVATISAFISDFRIYHDNGVTETDIHNWALDSLRPSGSYVKAYDSTTDEWNLTSYHWNYPPIMSTRIVASDIASSVTSRAFALGEIRSRKTWLTGQATVAHRGPTWSMSVTGDTAYDTVTCLTDKTYDSAQYGVHGKPDYNGDPDLFDDPHRENYAPVVLGDTYSYGEDLELEDGTAWTTEADVQIERDVRGVIEGIPLDKQQEHTEQFGIGLCSSWLQATITNTTGTLALTELTFEAKPMRHGLKDLKE